jgi:phosphoglycolate phosphatase
MQQIDLLITDLDNTLYDWFAAWYASFRPMLDALVSLSGFSEEYLIGEIKTIHERYGTSEYPFVIPELPCLRGVNVSETYAKAIDAYNAGRSTLALYEGVRPTLERLQNAGVMLVGYTESRSYYTHRRLRDLRLDALLDYVYSPPDHEFNVANGELRTLLPVEALAHSTHRLLKEGEVKPNPAVLLDIIAEAGGRPEHTLYVGDDLVKDVSMANAAGVTAVWARYGSHKDERYELLRRVTHWTRDAVERQRTADAVHYAPDVTVDSFAELLDHFTFRAHADARYASIR